MCIRDRIWFVRALYSCLLSSDWDERKNLITYKGCLCIRFPSVGHFFHCTGTMTSPRISTCVVDIFTRSFVIPNVVSIKFYRQPDGYCYIAFIPVSYTHLTLPTS